MKSTIMIIFLVSGLLGLTWQVFSDEDGKYASPWRKTTGIAPVTNKSYAEECGACHYAYPPGLLPASSWRRIMAGLDKHFGDNAELEAAMQRNLTAYLVKNSADSSPYRHSRKFVRSLMKNTIPVRITKTPYFRREHRKIPGRLVTKNPKVGSLSNCNACHRRADTGSFREREINIPGYGNWDD